MITTILGGLLKIITFIISKVLLPIFLIEIAAIVLILLVKLISILKIKKSYVNKKFKMLDSYKFMPYCKLPNNPKFFKELEDPSLCGTVLPRLNLNDYCFEGISLVGCRFNKKTVLPTDTDFFQKIKNKDLTDCTLPSGDYSNFNFDGVRLTRAKFTKDSTLPKNVDFFSNLNNSFLIVNLPDNFKDSCHLYDYSKIILSLNNKLELSEEQIILLYCKYGSKIEDFVKV